MDDPLVTALLRIGYRDRNRVYFDCNVHRRTAEMGVCKAALHHQKRDVDHRGAYFDRPWSDEAPHHEMGLGEYERNERVPRLFVRHTGRRFTGADFHSLDHIVPLCEKAAHSQGLEKAADLHKRSAHDIDLRFWNRDQFGMGLRYPARLRFLPMGHPNGCGRYGRVESFSGLSGGNCIFIRQAVFGFDDCVYLAEKKENKETIPAGEAG